MRFRPSSSAASDGAAGRWVLRARACCIAAVDRGSQSLSSGSKRWRLSDRALVTVVAISISGARVARELDLLATHRGKPATIVSDNGPEFISKAMDAWAYGAGVKLHFIRPGKPVENADVESFNAHFRDECLNMHWFTSVHDAARIIEAWKDDYNHHRPHSSLDGLTPAEFADKVKAELTLSAA